MSNHLLSGMILKNYKVNDTNDMNVKVSQEKTGPVILIALIFLHKNKHCPKEA